VLDCLYDPWYIQQMHIKVGRCYKTKSNSWPLSLRNDNKIFHLKANDIFLIIEEQFIEDNIHQFAIFYKGLEYILRIHKNSANDFDFVV
jgi:hypothetical protein